MPTRARLKIKDQWLNDAIGYMENSSEILQRVGAEVYQDNVPNMLSELSEDPGPVKYPIEWTSEKQRRFVFAKILKKDAKGNIIPYVRTGALAKGWSADMQSGEGFVFTVLNAASRAARFVYGSLALSSMARAARFKQRFHTNTGWLFAAPIVVGYFEDIQRDITVGLSRVVAQLGTPEFKKWGITPRLPKRREK